MLFSEPLRLLVLLSPLLIKAFPLASNDYTSSIISSRAPRDARWETCYARGVRYYNALQIATANTNHRDTTGGDIPMRAYTIADTPNVDAPAGIQGPLRLLDVPTNGYIRTTLTKPLIFADPVFDNLYDPRSGTIVAIDNNRDRDRTDLPARRIGWAEQTYQSYNRLANTGHYNLNRIRQVVQYHIVNMDSVGVIADVYTSAGRAFEPVGDWTRWTYQDDREEFLALLGTPNAVGTAKMLTDHAGAFGRRRIGSIYTHVDGPHMLISIS